MTSRPRMLICEDEEDTARGLQELFGRQYRISVGCDVDRCLALLRSSTQERDPNHRFAVVIIDLSFKGESEPNTRGFRILDEVRKDPFLEPVVYTGTGKHVEKAIESYERGAFRYIIKGMETKDGEALKKGSIAKLKKAVSDATACWRRLVQLDARLGQLMKAHPRDRDILPHARFIFEYIQQIRGRGRRPRH